MKCPACDHRLIETQVGSVVVDICQGGCGGIWFDAFELKRVDEEHEPAGEHLLHIRRDPTRLVDPARKRDCPRCHGVKLKRHFFSPKRLVEVDHCPNCSGYWLDAGELAKIRDEQKPATDAKPGGKDQLPPEVIRYLYRLQIEIRSTQRSLD